MGSDPSEATGGAVDNSDYQRLRSELLGLPKLKGLIPKFVRTCRDSFQFWQFIKHKFGTYAERRTFIWNSFAPVFEKLEAHEQLPSDTIASMVLRKLDEAHILGIWERALDRRVSDPEGAITIARTLLETVCKHILDDLKAEYSDDTDLPKLYHLTAKALNIAPSQHTAVPFRAILGACQTIVNNLGT